VKVLIFLFYFLYVGTESGFSGWISMYSLAQSISSNESHAAFLCSYFWIGLTVGRVLAIPQSLVLSASTMVRVQLLLTVVSSSLFFFRPVTSYATTAATSCFFGFALSSIFPLMMILVGDYGFLM
jgi:fucose permease